LKNNVNARDLVQDAALSFDAIYKDQKFAAKKTVKHGAFA